MPKVLLSVPHLLQRGDGDCLAACAAMVLAYLDRVMDDAKLLSLLKIRPHALITPIRAHSVHVFD